MAKAVRNVVTNNYSGKLGDIILRVVDGRSIISKYPRYKKFHWSRAQKRNQSRFRDAVAYAGRAVEDPVMREYYKSKVKWGQHERNVAISDYLLNPEIQDIDVSNYRGQEGNIIKITTINKYKIAAVIVTILNAAGFEVESGMAVEYPYGASGEWFYKTLEPNPEWRGGRVVVRVTDSPGKVVTSFQVLDG